MKNQDLENKIKNAFSNATPDIFDSVSKDCNTEKGTVIYMEENKKQNKWIKQLVTIAAAFAIAFSSIGIYNVCTGKAETTKVSLDVNPSIEMTVNKNEKVVNVTPRNEDGKKVVGNMKLENTDLETAVNAIIGSMVKNGYISELANSILISVDGKSQKNMNELQDKISSQINEFLQNNNLESAVLTQNIIGNNSKVREFSKKHNISEGRAKFILEFVKSNAQYNADDLAELTVNELNILAQGSNKEVKNVKTQGQASEKAYIGSDKAKSLAFEYANVSSTNAKNIDVDFEAERIDGKMMLIYEVDFDVDNVEYDVDIDAVSGNLVKIEKETIFEDNDKDEDKDKDEEETDEKDDDIVPDKSYIGDQIAKEKALSFFSLKEKDVKKLDCELEKEKGKVVYDIEFIYENQKYDVHIDAASGEVLKTKKELISKKKKDKKDDDDDDDDKDVQIKPELNYIGNKVAIDFALHHAGIKKDQAHDIKCKFEKENGKIIYEVEFDYGEKEYQYDIDAITGSIIKNTVDEDD